MVNVIELTKPIKVSGKHSFLVQLTMFDTDVVDAIKQLPTFYYHKAAGVWEIPVNCLAQLLDSLTFITDVKLVLEPEDKPATGLAPLSDQEISEFKIKPYDHQIEAINYGLSTETGKWLLLDSMGLGKTNEIIWYAETLKHRGLIDHALIICGVDSLRQNWKAEIGKFSKEDCVVLGEKISKKGRISYAPVADRAKQLKDPIEEFFVIVNIATIRNDKIVDAIMKGSNKFGLIALDEAHRVATKSSQQGSNLLKLKSDYKIAATGTLLTNNPLSAYVPLAWTENDHATLTMYKSQYCTFGGFNNAQIVGYKNLDLLREEITGCMIRRTLDQVRDDMPKKIVNYELVEMSDAHRKFYEAVKEGVKEEADKINLNSSNLLALTTRLRQATADPGILTTQPIESSKIERAVEIVEDLIDQGEKVVVLSTFKDPINRLASSLKKYKPLIATGDLTDQACFYNMQQFQEKADAKLFLGTHSKCGTGFTLNAAMYCVMLDTPWTDAGFSQSADRIWRVNNTRPAIITVLACTDSIDERVRTIVEEKKDLADYVVDGKETSVSPGLRDELMSIIKSL